MMAGCAARLYRTSRRCSSRKLRFSSTTRMVRQPLRKFARESAARAGTSCRTSRCEFPAGPARRRCRPKVAQAPASDRNRICPRWRSRATPLSPAPKPDSPRSSVQTRRAACQPPRVHLLFQHQRERGSAGARPPSSRSLPESESPAGPDRPSPCRRRRNISVTIFRPTQAPEKRDSAIASSP